MKKVKLTPRERKTVIGGSILTAIIVLIYFVLDPFLDRKRALEGDIEQKTAIFKQYIQIIQDKEALQGRKNELNQRLEKASAKLLDETVPAMAAVKLGEIADKILLKTVEVQDRLPIKGEQPLREEYQKVTTQMSFQCQIDQLIPALYEIQNYDSSLLSIDELKITYEPHYQTGKNPKLKPLQVNLKLSTIIRYRAQEKKDDKAAGRVKLVAAGLRS